MSKNSKIEFSQIVNAPVSAVYYAFTNQAAIVQWLCNNAQVDVREGGTVFFKWNQPQYYAVGEYSKIKPNKRVAFTWHGRGEPGPTAVEIKFKEDAGSTNISLVHKKVGEGPEWDDTREQIRRGWENGLENLKQVLEDGLDKRVYDQPFLGVMIAGLVSAEEAEAQGIEAQGGIRIGSVIEGTSADAAGLKARDILVSMAEIDTDSYPKLQRVLREHEVGDEIAFTYYRDGEKQSSEMTLSKRPAPDVPDSPAELSRRVEDLYKELNKELDEIAADLPEVIADYELPDDMWNAKQIMAHLLITERSMQMWIASMVDNQSLIGWPNNPQAWIRSAAESYTMGDIVEAFKNSESESVRLLANLPQETVSRKATYIQIGFNVLEFFPNHIRGHLNELRQAIAKAQEEAG
jgi:uncharacterized protein YndB with AHSA1/START domain